MSAKLDLNLLAQWAGEEFLASGRGDERLRSLHRRRAEILSDAVCKLRQNMPECPDDD